MIYRPVQTLANAGIRDVMVVTGGPHAGHFIRTLKNGEDFGLRRMEYAYQEGAGGIAGALSLTEAFADGNSVAVILGDNCTDADIGKEVREFDGGAMIFLKEVPDPERFGVPDMFTDRGGNERIKAILEKPKKPPSEFAVTGLYIYDNTVYDKIRTIEPSARGELEITDVNNLFLREGTLRHSRLEGYWRDAGTFETLLEVSNYWGKERR
jgi:glucose-1-phosphate thymidylyltransferase